MMKIKDLIEMANEQPILKRINERIKLKKDNFEKSSKRYWKLSASERLHYDSRRDRIDKEYEFIPLSMTLEFIRIFFYSTIFLLVLKLLFDLDRSVFFPILVVFINIIPMIFMVAITIDIFYPLLSHVFVVPKKIKKLNKQFKIQD